MCPRTLPGSPTTRRRTRRLTGRTDSSMAFQGQEEEEVVAAAAAVVVVVVVVVEMVVVEEAA